MLKYTIQYLQLFPTTILHSQKAICKYFFVIAYTLFFSTIVVLSPCLQGNNNLLPEESITSNPLHPFTAPNPKFYFVALPPMVYTVTSTANSGVGTLNEAIANANTNAGVDTIRFNIGGVGSHTISLTSTLPQITEGVYIDGGTQPGTVIGDLINGIPHQLQISIVNGAAISSGIRGSSTASGTTIRGLAIGGFNSYGIEFDSGADNISLEAVVVGANIGGTAANANDVGIIFWDTDNTVVRNSLVAGNTTDGVVFRNDSNNNSIYQNLIGVNMSGTTAISNGDHNVYFRGSGGSNTIGGTGFSFRNVLSGSKWGAHFWAGDNNELNYNYIGTDITGTSVISNTEAGLEVCAGANGTVQNNVIGGNNNCGITLWGGSLTGWRIVDNIIGTDLTITEDLGNGAAGVCVYTSVDCTVIEGNVIVNSTASVSSTNINTSGANGAGIWLRESASETFISQNSIYNNASLGIDIGNNGTPDLNDDGDGDTGPNNVLNYPVIESVYISGSDLCIEGWTGAGTSIEFYIADGDASNFGEGQTFLFSAVEGSGDDSDATQSTYGPAAINSILQGTYTNENRFTFCEALVDLSTVPTASDNITATASIASGSCIDGFTSEFSGKAVMPCSAPSNVKAFAIQASCTNENPNDDASLQISALTGGDRVNYIADSDYTSGDSDYADAISIGALPFVFITGLDNPTGGAQDYTLRIFNGSDDCYTDVTIVLEGQDCTIGCACTENIYLNETTTGAAKIHKFGITPTGGSLVPTEIGNPWFDNNAASETFTAPHGLGTDLNGKLYIAESDGGDIRQFDCDGNVTPATDYEIAVDGVWNIGSIGNTLYTNIRWDDGKPDGIYAFNLCDGSILGYFCLNNLKGNGQPSWEHYKDWGLYLEPDGTMYVTDSYFDTAEQNDLWVFNVHTAALNDPTAVSPVCIDPLISSDDGTINIGDSELPTTDIWGVTADTSGNIYIIEQAWNSRILKYSSSGELLATSDWDTAEGTTYPGTNPATGVAYTNNDRGFYKAIGIVYSETSNRLYTSTTSPTDDCVALFDTDLNYLGAAVPYTNNTSTAKGISKLNECCPTNNNIVIDTTLCGVGLNQDIFLQELINCEGTICEGIWTPSGGNTGLTYNSCNNSVTIDALNACGSFTLSSDGVGNNPQCGAFRITVNVEVEDISTNTISANQTICYNTAPSPLTSNATSSSGTISYQWQSSTDDCSTNFSNIPTANGSSYTPAALTQTTYYRLITSVGGTCSSGSCSDTTNCVIIAIRPERCGRVDVIRN